MEEKRVEENRVECAAQPERAQLLQSPHSRVLAAGTLELEKLDLTDNSGTQDHESRAVHGGLVLLPFCIPAIL